MAKTYIPQFIRILRHLAVYATKHGATMNPQLTSGQQAAVQSVITAAQAFNGVNIQETP